MQRVRHRQLYKAEIHRPAFVDTDSILGAFLLEPRAVSKIATIFGLNFLASGKTSFVWSKCACEIAIASTLSIL